MGPYNKQPLSAAEQAMWDSWGRSARSSGEDLPPPPEGPAPPVDQQIHPPGPPSGPAPHDAGAPTIPRGHAVFWWQRNTGTSGPAASEPQGPPPAPTGPNTAPRYQPPGRVLTTLGWLKHLDDPAFPYYEHHYLQIIYEALTWKWGTLQGGDDEKTMQEWFMLLKFLEVDRKAKVDLMLLAQSGHVGRCKANEILWNLLSVHALDPRYEDLSNKISNLVGWARRSFDRPPREHADLKWWWWSCYEEPAQRDLKWSPRAVPAHYSVAYGPGLMPQPPPACFGPPRHHQ